MTIPLKLPVTIQIMTLRVYITAVYDKGESVSSNEHEVDVLEGMEEYLIHSTIVYPNPATDVVNIISDYNIESIKAYNSTGQVIIHEIVDKTDSLINTSMLEPGPYLF